MTGVSLNHRSIVIWQRIVESPGFVIRYIKNPLKRQLIQQLLQRVFNVHMCLAGSVAPLLSLFLDSIHVDALPVVELEVYASV